VYRNVRVVIRWRKFRVGTAVLARLIFCGVWRWRWLAKPLNHPLKHLALPMLSSAQHSGSTHGGGHWVCRIKLSGKYSDIEVWKNTLAAGLTGQVRHS
jgi:hypothetical protein